MTQIDKALEAILAQDMQEIFLRQQREYASIVSEKVETLILFGAGWLGKETAGRLTKLAKKFRVFFCDNNPATPKEIAGIPVLSKEEAVESYADSALFLVTIFNGSTVLDQLKKAGCKYVLSYVTFYRAFPDEMLPLCSLAKPHPIAEDKDQIRKAYKLLADDESRQEFLNILKWETTGPYQRLARLHPGPEIYFAPDLVKPKATDRFVDCGAYDGDSIRMFINKWDQKFERIAGFEPISANFKRLGEYRASLPPAMGSKMDIHPFALASVKGPVHFSVDGNASSRIHGHFETTIEAVRLDDHLADFHPTFLKMDIEGAEVDALTGATNILKNDAPLLTITLYHDIRHLWQVPLLIHAANPSYKLYLRKYADDCWETVCYAIPPGR